GGGGGRGGEGEGGGGGGGRGGTMPGPWLSRRTLPPKPTVPAALVARTWTPRRGTPAAASRTSRPMLSPRVSSNTRSSPAPSAAVTSRLWSRKPSRRTLTVYALGSRSSRPKRPLLSVVARAPGPPPSFDDAATTASGSGPC